MERKTKLNNKEVVHISLTISLKAYSAVFSDITTRTCVSLNESLHRSFEFNEKKKADGRRIQSMGNLFLEGRTSHTLYPSAISFFLIKSQEAAGKEIYLTEVRGHERFRFD